MPSILNATTTSGLVTSADNSGSLQLQTNNGTTAVTIDTSQNVGIGTTSPQTKLNVSGGTIRNTGSNGIFEIQNGNTAGGVKLSAYNSALNANGYLAFEGYTAEYGRFDSSGNLVFSSRSGAGNTGQLQVGTTSSTGANAYGVFTADSSSPYPLGVKGLSSGQGMVGFFDSGNTVVGSISKSGSNVAYNTSSDYRLKENIAPMTGALAKVAQLKPVTYTWKVDGSNGQGFIAHELQAVVPDCVSGEKDAVETYIDEEGNEQTRPKYQGIDTSFLVATLTAAIQEQQAQIEELKAEVQALKGVA